MTRHAITHAGTGSPPGLACHRGASPRSTRVRRDPHSRTSTDMASDGLALYGPPEPLLRLRCVRSRVTLLDRRSGRRIPGRCGHWSCAVCAVPMAIDVGRALALAAPEYALRLSLVGDHVEQIRSRFKRFHRRVRRDVQVFEHAFSVEPNPGGTGAHTHGWIHGSELDAAVIQDAAVHAGMGREIHLEQAFVPDSNDPALTYGLKMLQPPMGHMPGSPEHAASAKRFLELNGQRPVSVTEHFWRDGQTGVLLRDRREAVRMSRERAGLRDRYAIVPTQEITHGGS